MINLFQKLKSVFAPHENIDITPKLSEIDKRISLFEEKQDQLLTRVEYLYYRMIRMDERIRDLIHQVGVPLNEKKHNASGFEDKWRFLNYGKHSLLNPEHKEKVKNLILDYTGLAENWFIGKKVLDAGCGDGRLSYGLLQLGANVTSIDISEEGVEKTKVFCSDVANERHKTMVADLLQPLDSIGNFDLIISFGVVHHSGDTRKAIENLYSVLLPGGYLSFMVYGYPRFNVINDFTYQIKKDSLHFKTRGMPITEVLDLLSKDFDDLELRGWYDAIMPIVEDYYLEEQLVHMMKEIGFHNIIRLEPSISNPILRGGKE